MTWSPPIRLVPTWHDTESLQYYWLFPLMMHLHFPQPLNSHGLVLSDLGKPSPFWTHPEDNRSRTQQKPEKTNQKRCTAQEELFYGIREENTWLKHLELVLVKSNESHCVSWGLWDSKRRRRAVRLEGATAPRRGRSRLAVRYTQKNHNP